MYFCFKARRDKASYALPFTFKFYASYDETTWFDDVVFYMKQIVPNYGFERTNDNTQVIMYKNNKKNDIILLSVYECEKNSKVRATATRLKEEANKIKINLDTLV